MTTPGRSVSARTRRTAGLVVAGSVAGVVAAAAFWAASGSGSATSSSGTTSPVTLTAGTPVAALHPGATAPVRLTMTNPGGAEVRVGSLVLDTAQGSGGFAVDAAHPDCDESVLSYAAQANGGAGWTVPGGGSVQLTLADALTMSADADTGCQGATFTVYLAVSG